jgi:hypothetical protein
VCFNRMAFYGDQWMAFMNTVWGPVDGCFGYDIGTSGWLLRTRYRDVGTSEWLV